MVNASRPGLREKYSPEAVQDSLTAGATCRGRQQTPADSFSKRDRRAANKLFEILVLALLQNTEIEMRPRGKAVLPTIPMVLTIIACVARAHRKHVQIVKYHRDGRQYGPFHGAASRFPYSAKGPVQEFRKLGLPPPIPFRKRICRSLLPSATSGPAVKNPELLQASISPSNPAETH